MQARALALAPKELAKQYVRAWAWEKLSWQPVQSWALAPPLQELEHEVADFKEEDDNVVYSVYPGAFPAHVAAGSADGV